MKNGKKEKRKSCDLSPTSTLKKYLLFALNLNQNQIMIK
jgi:hypothetical protein